jgi:hypothetical protein
MKLKDTGVSVSLLTGALTIGLSLGWVAGSARPWTLIPIIIGLALGFVWIVWAHVQLQKDMRSWERHAETARRLLDETEGEDPN